MFAWGLASDGRLGFDVKEKPGKFSRSSHNVHNDQLHEIVMRPKAVFGSLHLVTGLASSAWHTMLIAGLQSQTLFYLRAVNVVGFLLGHNTFLQKSVYHFSFD